MLTVGVSLSASPLKASASNGSPKSTTESFSPKAVIRALVDAGCRGAVNLFDVASTLERYRRLTLISSIDWFSLASLKESELLGLSSRHAV